MIKSCGPDMQVQKMTSNIRKMTVNLRSSKYMYINKSESKKCMENGIESIGTHNHATKYGKHVINTLNT